MNNEVQNILNQTDAGQRVFLHYGCTIGGSTLSPLNPSDTKPSFNIYYNEKSGRYRFKDFGENGIDSQGDCVDFVRKMFNLSFRDALIKIITDLKLKK